MGNLALADLAVDIADRNLQRTGSLGSASAADAYAIPRDFLNPYLRKIRRYVGLEISGGIVHLVEQLLLASLRRHPPAPPPHLADDNPPILPAFPHPKPNP